MPEVQVGVLECAEEGGEEMRELKFRQYHDGQFFRWGYLYGNDVFVSPVHGPSEQHTGLQDKNGVEIYEGDIIDCMADFEPDIHTWQVVYAGGAWRLQARRDENYWYEWSCFPLAEGEVIGNIHENPEFLKGPR